MTHQADALPAMRPSPVRVLMVTPRFYPERGGVESHVLEVSRRLARDPVMAIQVLTTDVTGDLPGEQVMDGVRVSRVRAWPRQGDLYYAPAIYRRVVAAKADLVHLQGYHTLVAPLALLGARRAALPYVVTLHSGGHSSGLRRAIRPLQAGALRPLLARAERLIAVSRFEADLFAGLLKIPGERVPVIPNGADTPSDTTDEDAPQRDANLVVSVGRLERYKGHHRLIEALPAILERRPEVRVVIAGSGPYDRQLRQLAAERNLTGAVEIRGMPREEVYVLLQRAAVAALLSDYESQGIAAYEALAAGCRLVVLDTTALAELTRYEAVSGVPRDATPGQIATAVLDALEAPHIATGGRAALPTWDECAARLREVYLAALA